MVMPPTLRFRECPECHRYIPYLQAVCDCGRRFTGSERKHKVCFKCGSIVPSSKLLCDCGHFFPLERFFHSQVDTNSAYNSGYVAGIMAERKRQSEATGKKEPPTQDEPRYLVETEDGFQVSVPASKLEAWKKAQSAPPAPLTPAEERVKRRILEYLYGSHDGDDGETG